MIDPFDACVIDASVAIQALLPEPLSAQATALLAGAARAPKPRLHVPDLFYAECANVLWKAVRRLRLPPSVATASARDLAAMDLVRIPMFAVFEGALEVALAYSISVYDACYVAPAEMLRIPLVTADEKLVRKLAGAPYDVRWLGSLRGA